MKIGIITPYDADNMGAMLQARALKIYLSKKNYEVSHVRVRSDDETWKFFSYNCPGLDINLIRYFPRFFKHPIDNFKAFPMFIETCKRYIWIQKRKKIFRQHLSFFDEVDLQNEKFNLYIIGSDEVWNVRSSIFQKDIFWGIGYSPAIVYAASMSGSSFTDFAEHPKYINAMESVAAVTLRDRKSIDVFKKCTELEAEKVVDPTFLISEKIDRHTGLRTKERILVYGYENQWDEDIKRQIIRFAHKHHLQIVSVWFYLEFADKNILCKPEEFENIIAESRYVITTTFHGSIFSILGGANFATYSPRDKARELLEDLHLESRILEKNCPDESLETILLNRFDIDVVERKIANERERSKAILDRMIEENAKN